MQDAISSLGVLVLVIADKLQPNLITPEWAIRKMMHKAELRLDEEGELWFNKACQSNRTATAILNR
eukprot:9031920-Lingulodinium_polyedra.AAC.1